MHIRKKALEMGKATACMLLMCLAVAACDPGSVPPRPKTALPELLSCAIAASPTLAAQGACNA